MEETRERIIGEITALKMLLRDTDYEVTKYAEGLTACTTQKQIEAYRGAFMEQYGEVIENRKAWRAKINELEDELAALDDEDTPAPDGEPENNGYIDYPEYADNGADIPDLAEEDDTEAPAPAEDDGAEGTTEAETGEDQEQPE